MNKILRKIVVVAGTAAVSVGLMSALAMPADAAVHAGTNDSSWGRPF